MSARANALALLTMVVAGTYSSNSLAQVPPRISGSVVTADGSPVQGVRVMMVGHGSTEESPLASETNAQGEFSLNPTQKLRSVTFALVAYKSGYAVGYVQQQTSEVYNENGAVPTAKNVKIKLVKPHPVSFQLVDPSGRPVANVPIYGRAISEGGDTRFYSGRPEGVPQLTRTTDGQGNVTLDYLPPNTVASLTIVTQEHGTQMASVSAMQTADEPKLELLPSGNIKIVLKSNDSTDVGGRKITLQTNLENRPTLNADQPRMHIMWATTKLTTDKLGVAEGRVLAGKILPYMQGKPEDTSFLEMPSGESFQLAGGKTVERRYEFKPGLQIGGRVVDTDGNTVPGVSVKIQSRTVTTDENGEYKGTVSKSAQVSFRTEAVPKGYVLPYQQWGGQISREVAEGEQVARQADIIVGLATHLTGTVIDADGNAVAGATVDAAWQAHDPSGSTFTRKSDQTTTDADGNYVFLHVQKDCDVRLTAKTQDLASPPTTLHTESEHDVELTVTREGMMSVTGTVKGSLGQAITNARVEINRAMLVADGSNYGNRRMKLDGQDSFAASKTGKFVTPIKLPRYGKYAIKVSAPGFLSSQTEFLQAGDAGDLDAGETQLVQARIASGKVVDSSGNPLTGITVSAYSAQKVNGQFLKRITAKTEADGKFHLLGLHPHAAFALVQHDGYRLTGIPLVDGVESLTTLYREGQAIAAKDRVGTNMPHHEIRHATAKAFLAKIGETRRDSNYFHSELASMLFRTGPEAALAELENTKSASTRASLLEKLGESAEAAAEASGISDPYRRCFANVRIAESCEDEELWRDILSSVLLDAEQVKRPDRRLVCICRAADAFMKKGDKEFAKLIVTSQLDQAKELSTKEWAGYARASYAENLSLFDYEAAMEMVDEAEDDDKHRHLQNIAHRLGAVDPQKAEQTIKKISKSNYVDSPVVRTAYRMAKVDLDRALGLVELINKSQRRTSKARALGVIAVAIHEEKPDRARRILKQAFDSVSTAGGHRADQNFRTAKTLLRYAEQVDPDNLTDYFWRTVSLYGGPAGYAWSPEQAREKDAERQADLAVIVAMYDQPDALLKQMTEPIFAHWEKRVEDGIDSSRFTDQEIAFTAMSLADPERAAKWGIAFENAVNEKNRRYIPQPWEVIGNTLTLERNELGKRLTKKVHHRWVIDEYDF